MAAILFDRDDDYLNWVANHPNGIVLNVRSTPSGAYMMMHRASCKSITVGHEPGAYTERGYRKVCAATVAEIREWASRHDGTPADIKAGCNCRPPR